jgi:hypothetical protein
VTLPVDTYIDCAGHFAAACGTYFWLQRVYIDGLAFDKEQAAGACGRMLLAVASQFA